MGSSVQLLRVELRNCPRFFALPLQPLPGSRAEPSSGWREGVSLTRQPTQQLRYRNCTKTEMLRKPKQPYFVEGCHVYITWCNVLMTF